MRRSFKTLVPRVVHYVLEYHFYSVLKSPLNNKPKSNIVFPSAVDLYFGMNIHKYKDGTVQRTVYGIHSGSSTIGMEPCAVRIPVMNPDMVKLTHLMKLLAQRHFRDVFPGVKVDCDFNLISMKIYWTTLQNRTKVVEERMKKNKSFRPKRKKCGSHCDTEFDRSNRNNKPKPSNSQREMSAVVIVVYGDAKWLDFELWEFGPHGDGGKPGKRKVPGALPYRFKQDCFTIIVLDPRDEYMDGYKRWWQHKSECYHSDGVSISMMFRCCKSTLRVKDDGAIVDPSSPGPTKEKWFAEEHRRIAQDKSHDSIIDNEISYVIGQLGSGPPFAVFPAEEEDE